MLRIIDKETKLFLRDDLYYNEEVEEALDVEPAQGLCKPKWDGEKWVEGATQEEVDNIKNVPQEPTPEEKEKEQLKQRIDSLEETILNLALGGMM